jgi:hypothetical protein
LFHSDTPTVESLICYSPFRVKNRDGLTGSMHVPICLMNITWGYPAGQKTHTVERYEEKS